MSVGAKEIPRLAIPVGKIKLKYRGFQQPRFPREGNVPLFGICAQYGKNKSMRSVDFNQSYKTIMDVTNAVLDAASLPRCCRPGSSVASEYDFYIYVFSSKDQNLYAHKNATLPRWHAVQESTSP